ncbi:hypothetical protein ACFLRB_06260 [Acidobacteriota bacterium]
MLKKEFREIIIPAISRIGTMALFLLVISIVNGSPLKISLYIICCAYVILWISNCYGIGAFRHEYRDNAFEYLLSFPLSKCRIAVNKLLPRVAVLVLLTAIYEVLAVIHLLPILRSQSFQVDSFALFDPLFFPIGVVYFFGAGFSVGLFEWKSLRILIGFLTLLFTIFISIGIKTLFDSLSVSFSIFYYLYGISFIIAVVIVTGIMGAAFVSVYKKFDLKPSQFHRKKFILRSLPLLLLITAISIAFTILQDGF